MRLKSQFESRRFSLRSMDGMGQYLLDTAEVVLKLFLQLDKLWKRQRVDFARQLLLECILVDSHHFQLFLGAIQHVNGLDKTKYDYKTTMFYSD